MANIMTTDWDEPVDEGTVGTVAKIGALAGVGGGIYEGIKRHKIDERRRDERQLKIGRLLHGVQQDNAKRAEHRKTMAEKRREYAEKKLDRKIRDTESDLDEGVGKAVGLAALGYTTYQMAKEPVAELVRDALNAKDKAAREHEYAFRETPKDTARRVQRNIKRKIQHESVENTLDESVISNIKAYLKGRKVAKQTAKVNVSKLQNADAIRAGLNKKLASDIAAVRKTLNAHIKNSDAPEISGFHLSSSSHVSDSCNYAVRPTIYGFGIEFIDWDLWDVYPDDARTRFNNDDCAGFWKVYSELGTIIRDHFGGSGRVLGKHAVISDTGDWDGGSIELFISNADALRILGDETSAAPRNESAAIVSKVW